MRGWTRLSQSGGDHEPLLSGRSSIWGCPHVRALPCPAVALSHRGGGQPAGPGVAANPRKGVSSETPVAGWRRRPGSSTWPRRRPGRCRSNLAREGLERAPAGATSRAVAPLVVSANSPEIADGPELSDHHPGRLLSSRPNVAQARAPGRGLSWTKLLPAPPPRPGFGLRGGRRSQGQSLPEFPGAQPGRQSSSRQR